MKLLTRPLLSACIAAAFILPAIAGSFVLDISNALASPEAKSKGAVLVVRTTSCHEPEKSTIAATAEGLVDGKRHSVKLTMIPLSEAGAFAIRPEWPDKGVWAIRVVASNPAYTSYHPGALIPVNGDTLEWAQVKRFNREPTVEEANAVLSGREFASRK